jgi:hypothetical protein
MSMAIQRTLCEVKSVTALQAIVEQAEVRLSLCGERYLSFSGFSGNLPVDALAARVIELVDSNFEFSEEERSIGRKIAAEIDSIYIRSDDLVRVSNIITCLLAHLRDMWCDNIADKGYGIRWQWRYNRENELFEYYTKNQYEKVFNKSPIGLRCRSQTNCPDRWHV